IPTFCEPIVQHPITKVFHMPSPKCYEHLTKDEAVFCNKLRGFSSTKVGKTFSIAYGMSEVVISCSNHSGTLKAYVAHCRTPTGIYVEPGRSEAFNDQGDSIHCEGGIFYPPVAEFNNRAECVVGWKVPKLKFGQKSENGELECRGDGKSKADLIHLGCNLTSVFVKVDSYGMVNGRYEICHNMFSRAGDLAYLEDCADGKFKPGDMITSIDGVRRFRCVPPKEGEFVPGKEEFVGCSSLKALDPLKSPFFYNDGEMMEEYGQKCTKDFKLNTTGKEIFCENFGLKYELGSWQRVLISDQVGHFYFCENDNGKPKNVFRGCFRRDSYNLINAKLTTQQEEEEKKCSSNKLENKKD
ncbi:hypothetical protein PMAYCL1PPCAC_13030, partial [Pristionchus mayeri]